MVYGPVVNSQKTSSLNTSNAIIWRIIGTGLSEVPQTGLHLWVDVRDIARAHVRALTAPGASNKRIIIAAIDIYSTQQIADIARAKFPQHGDRIPKGTPGAGLGEGGYYVASNALSKEVLGMTYRGFETTLTGE